MTADDKEAQEAVMYLADQALLELGKQAFQALVDASGMVDAAAAMKPYKNRNAYILLCMMKKRINLLGTTIDKLITPLALAQATLGGPENVHQEIRERGAECRVDKCPYQDASPEFCVVISHFTSDLMCEAINPDYEVIWTHHLTNGDPYCRYVYRKKNEPNKDTEDLGRIVMTLPPIEMPPHEAVAIRNFILTHWLDAVTEAFVDLHGSEKTISILVPIAKNIGREAGKWLAVDRKEMRRDAATIGHLVDLFGKGITQRGRTHYLSMDELVKEITDCPWQTLPYELCKQIEAIFQGVCESLNPELEYGYDSMIPKGDEICRWHMRLSGVAPTIIHQERPETMDPVAMLKMRLARGEIDRTEYEDLMVIISK